MNILAIDDEKTALNISERAIKEALPDANVLSYTRCRVALNDIKEKSFVPDIAFLDIEMPGMNGITLAKALKQEYPSVNIIFVTGFSEYAVEAHKLHVSGYIMKPTTVEQVREELENLRFPLKNDNTKKIIVRTFQNFEVYDVNGKPISFERNKSKEIFAYLIDREGTGATCAEIAAILWEEGSYDRSRQKQLNVFLTSLMSTLSSVGAEDVIIRKRNCIMVDVSKIDCDMYRFLNGDVEAINSYRGEYMSSYSWAEFTTAKLMKLI